MTESNPMMREMLSNPAFIEMAMNMQGPGMGGMGGMPMGGMDFGNMFGMGAPQAQA